MSQSAFKDAVTICKSVMRNGFDAHIVNSQLQHELMQADRRNEIDLATDAPPDELAKLFPALAPGDHPGVMGVLSEGGLLYRFYRMNISDSALPEVALTRLTPTLLQRMMDRGPVPRSLVNGMVSLSPPPVEKGYPGFDSFDGGQIRLEGLPDETLKSDYLLGIRALRYAANFDLPIEPNTWMAIIRNSQRILDYVPVQLFMDEWRKVEAENMWKFAQLLFDTQIMHGLLPEIAGLARVRQTRNDSGEEETVLTHTIACMKYYPEGEFHYDWLGTFALLFHDVGKLYTAEHFQGRWYFYEHHRVGAKVARKILRRLHMLPEDIELICGIIRNHMRFQFMMTDKGIRRFMAVPEHGRIIAISRAAIKAREDNYTAFNHNTKYLARAETPEQMLEPLLNGNEIMEVTGLKPGPHVGVLRQELLKAQIAGEVNNLEEARDFVCKWVAQNN